jgi:hypothetical protein
MSLYDRVVPSSDPSIQGHVYGIDRGYRWTVKEKSPEADVPLRVLTSGECPTTEAAFTALYRAMNTLGAPPS